MEPWPSLNLLCYYIHATEYRSSQFPSHTCLGFVFFLSFTLSPPFLTLLPVLLRISFHPHFFFVKFCSLPSTYWSQFMLSCFVFQCLHSLTSSLFLYLLSHCLHMVDLFLLVKACVAFSISHPSVS